MKIVQHCFGSAGSGGPVVAFERMISHSKLQYPVIRQVEAAGGINIALIYRFLTEIRRHRPELIHVRGLGNEGFHAVVAAKFARVPNILVSIHGTHRDLKQPANRFRHWIVKAALEPLTLSMATHIATVCEFAANRRFLVPYRHKLIGIVPNGVDIPCLTEARRTDVRKQLGVPDNWTIGICVSRVTTEKGYPVLASALSRLDSDSKDLAVLVVGGGDENKRLQSLFGQLKNIKVLFLGHRADVGVYLSVSDFFLFPSLHENLSNALIEAMAHGLPVIATAVGGNSEVVKKGGGVLVPPNDPKALADAIRAFVDNKSEIKGMGCVARENIIRNYSIERMVAGWEGVYERILGGQYGAL